jgi:sugar/nucleoside kinase (ribokinase family)
VVFVPAVGNSANAAVSAARLGLKSSLRAYVGDDRYGAECLERLGQEHVDTTYMVTEPGKKTNYHFVLWYESERTILVKHEDFSYTVPQLEHKPKWLYLSSLAANSLPYHAALAELLNANPEINLAFNPGTFQMSLGAKALKPLYERTDFFSCNKEEAGRILEEDDLEDIRGLLVGIHKLGPKRIVITDGTNGGYAFDGTRMMYIPMYPDTRGPYERTGAGDAFTSTVVSALALGETFENALLWGPINSMSVVQDVGAQKGLLTREQLLDLLAKAPKEYAIRDL